MSGPVAGYFQAATASSDLYNSQYNGFQPRLAVAYQMRKGTVIRSAFAMLLLFAWSP